MRSTAFYNALPDGTVKQVNPFTGTRVWAVPERGKKPVMQAEPLPIPVSSHLHSPEDYCVFCETRYYETSPEKTRIVATGAAYATLHHLPADRYFETTAEFRRLPNLFEIVSTEYWKKNYGYTLSDDLIRQKERYLASPEGRAHIESILRYKLAVLQDTTPDTLTLSEPLIDAMSDSFFGGCHELIVPRRHWATHGDGTVAHNSSGHLTTEQHFRYMRFAVDAVADIISHNPYARYVSVFQNWLAPAGASFDHLHKQLVAIDEWSETTIKQIGRMSTEPNAFNTDGPGLAAYYGLLLAENDHALAFVGIGHRFPTIEVYSRSNAVRPWKHTNTEIRAISDMVHAMHKAIGSEIACNEEWHYTPLDAPYPIPWHIFIRLRLNTLAGFEGGTGIFIHTITPAELCDMMIPRLFALRSTESIAPLAIADECKIGINPLRYIEAYSHRM